MGRLGSVEVKGFARGGISAAPTDANLYPFGYRTPDEATQMPPNVAVLAQRCTVRRGVVMPIYGPGAQLTGANVPTGAARSIFYLGNAATGRWDQTNTDAGGVIYDAGFGFDATYYSRDGSFPRAHSTKDNLVRPLGMLPPSAAPTGSGGAATGRYYRAVYKLLAANYGVDVRSNPSAVSALLSTANVVVQLPLAAEDVGSNFVVELYATAPGVTPDPAGPFYYCTELAAGGVAPGTVTLVGAGSVSVNQQRPLFWDLGGAPGNAFYTEDHYPPNGGAGIQRLADALLVNGVPGGVGSGIALASVESTLLVSLNNGPHYFPTAAWRQLDDFIEAIRCKDGQAWVLTRSSVYRVLGSDPYAMDLQRIPDLPAILPDSANAARWCEWGLLYPSKKGIILLGPSGDAVNLTQGTMHPTLWQGRDDLSAVFADGLYSLFDPDGDLAVGLDLRDGPNSASVVQLDWGLMAMPTACLSVPRGTTAASGGASRGVFTYSQTAGLRLWRPFEEEGVAGASPSSTWTWITPPLDAGLRGPKRWYRLAIDGGANLQGNAEDFVLFFYGFDANGKQVKTSFGKNIALPQTVPGQAPKWWTWIPTGFVCDYLQVAIIGQTRVTMRGFRLDYEVPDAPLR